MFKATNEDHDPGSTQGTTVPPPPSSIFRAAARRQQVEHREQIELPFLVSSRAFVYLWAISLLLVAIGAIVAIWPSI